jgi:hypothetical protein
MNALDWKENKHLINTFLNFLCHTGYLVVVDKKLRVPNDEVRYDRCAIKTLNLTTFSATAYKTKRATLKFSASALSTRTPLQNNSNSSSGASAKILIQSHSG